MVFSLRVVAVWSVAWLSLVLPPGAFAQDVFAFESSVPALAEPWHFDAPSGVAVSDGGLVFVADTGRDRIRVFGASGMLVAQWGGEGPLAGEFQSPSAVAWSRAGLDAPSRVYVADTGNNRVQVFDPDGEFRGQWGSAGQGQGQFDSPRGIAVDNTGRVYVADTGNDRIQVFDSDGNFVRAWGTSGNGDEMLDRPAGISVRDADNAIFVADSGNNRIQQFSPDGVLVRSNFGAVTGPAYNGPMSVSAGAAGEIFVGDTGNDRVVALSAEGVLIA